MSKLLDALKAANVSLETHSDYALAFSILHDAIQQHEVAQTKAERQQNLVDFNDPEVFRQAAVAVFGALDMRYVRCVRAGAPAKHPYQESDITRHVAALQLTRPDGEVVTAVIGVAEEPWKDSGVWCEPDHRALKYDFRLFEETMARVNQAWAGLMGFAANGWMEHGVGSAMPMLGDEQDQPKEN